MDKLIENYRELFRTLNRLHNTNKGLLLKGDIERLERARNILNAQTSNERRIVPSDELGDCNMPHVNGSASELTIRPYCFMCKNYAQSFTPVWCTQCKNENYSLYEPKR